MQPIVRRLGPQDGARWDSFVLSHPEGSFFHRAGWARVIEKAFGHRTDYVLAERDGEIVGVLPLTEIKSRVFGHALVSNAFCVQGGPLAVDAEARAALLAHAVAEMERTGAQHVELRQEEPGWAMKEGLYVTFRKPITGDHDVNLKAIPRKQRAMVRKAIDNGLVAEASRDAKLCHRVYAESVRNLGTPVFPRRYFQLLLDEFGEDSDVVTVSHQGTPVASVLNFYFRDEVLPYYGGGTAAARKLAANDLLYWEVMRRAADRGSRLFDFGRSKQGTGAYAFKKNWGFEPTPLTYAFRLREGAKLPDLNPLNPKFQLFIAAWRRLPLPVANFVGPFVVRNLG